MPDVEGLNPKTGEADLSLARDGSGERSIRGQRIRDNGAILPPRLPSPGPRWGHADAKPECGFSSRRRSIPPPCRLHTTLFRPVSQGDSHPLALNRTKSHQFEERKKRSPNVHSHFPNQSWSKVSLLFKAGQTSRGCRPLPRQIFGTICGYGTYEHFRDSAGNVRQTGSNQVKPSAERQNRRKNEATRQGICPTPWRNFYRVDTDTLASKFASIHHLFQKYPLTECQCIYHLILIRQYDRLTKVQQQ